MPEKLGKHTRIFTKHHDKKHHNREKCKSKALRTENHQARKPETGNTERTKERKDRT